MSTLPPPLKWAGGKRWALGYIEQYFQPYRDTHRLVEPFVGGMAVALGLNVSRVLINDINPHLINFYRWLQQGLVTEYPFIHDEAYYYQTRDKFNHTIRSGNVHSQEMAEMFYYLNRTGFNGLCRFNKSGELNVPFGRYRTINYTTNFMPYSSVMRNWHIHNEDFAQLAIHNGDFLYLDPPYDAKEDAVSNFTQYSKQGFDWAEQERLIRWLEQYPNPRLISNHFTPKIQELYQDYGYSLKIVDAPRRISRDGNRHSTPEVLAFKSD